jgi:hypothetical protein
LAIAVLGASVYQMNYVPQQGLDAEVESNRGLLSDAREFDFAVRESIITGQSQPVTFGDTVNYPVGFPTPPDPNYVISTTETETIQLENYACESGSCASEMNSTNVVMLGQYNYLQNDRTYGYEYGIVYSAPNATPEGDDGVISYNEQSVIDGDELTLIAFKGNFTNERRATAHATLTPRNAQQREFVVTDDRSPIVLTLPTELSEGRWRDALDDQLVENGGHITDITYQNYTVEKEGGDHPGRGRGGPPRHAHWEDCDHPGQGRPFVTCTIDNSTNVVKLTLERGEEYNVNTHVVELND